MTASRTSLLASLLGLGFVALAAPGSASADPDGPYCETLSAALPGIDATYQELKKTADLEVAADVDPADDDADADEADAPAKASKPSADLDEGALLQKEIELADRLSAQLNDLAHQTRESGMRRIAEEASSTAGSFAASLHAKQDGDAPGATARSNAGGEAPDAAPGVDVGMLGGLLHPNQSANGGDDWNADYNYNSNKLRNEMNALNHLCQASDLSQPEGSVQAGNRHGGS